MEEKVTYVEKVKVQVQECNSEVDRLAKRSSRASGEAKKVQEEEVADLRNKCDALTHRLEDAQWSEEAWDDVKRGIQSGLASLKSGIEKAKSRFG